MRIVLLRIVELVVFCYRSTFVEIHSCPLYYCIMLYLFNKYTFCSCYTNSVSMKTVMFLAVYFFLN